MHIARTGQRRFIIGNHRGKTGDIAYALRNDDTVFAKMAAHCVHQLRALPDQKLTPLEALRGFTTDAAWAGFMENEVGRLAPGMRADFVLLEADPLTAPTRQLPHIKVMSTWVDGLRVYDARR